VAKDDRIKAIELSGPDFIPVSIYFLPATWKKYRDELNDIAQRYPEFFGENYKESRDYDDIDGMYAAGEHACGLISPKAAMHT